MTPRRAQPLVAVLLAMPVLATLGGAQVAGEIRGRVTDAETARPVANARVELSGHSAAVRTNLEGTYVVRGLEPRTYSVSVHAVGYAAFRDEIEIGNGRVSVLDVVVSPQANTLRDVRVRADRDTIALNATVFDRAAIEASGRRDLGELLQRAPGGVVTQAGGPGQSSRISIRGSESNQVLVLVDGVPLNASLSGSADLSGVALETVERITLRTGAQSARYGARALAGVIEIETRSAQRELSTFLRTGALGEQNVAMALGTTVPFRRGDIGASLSADYRTVSGDFVYTLPAFRGGGQAVRINSDATSRQLLGRLSMTGGFGSAMLRTTWQDTRRGLAGTIIQPSRSGRQAHARSSAGGQAQGMLNRVAWTAAADVTREQGIFGDGTPPFGQPYHDTIRATGVTSSASATVGQGATSAAIGGELRTLDVRSTMLAPDAPRRQQLLGAWGNTRVSRTLPVGVRLDAELSARVDRNSLQHDVAVSPRAALRVSRGVLSTSLSVGAGYAPPTLSDQFFHEGVQVRANPSLAAERTRQDIEGRVTLHPVKIGLMTVSGDAAAYRANIDGMILWFPDFRFIWSPANYDVKRSGWELNGSVALPAAHLTLQGALSRSDVSYAGGVLTGQVAYRPRNSATANIAFAPRQLRVELNNQWIGTRRTVAGSPYNALAPYHKTDARLSTSFTQHRWTFDPALSIDNVLNREAAMLVDYPFPPRTWSLSLRVRRSPLP